MTQITLKWFKRFSLVLAIIPILLFLGFAGAVSLIDFNQYKPQIEQEISKLINRELEIKGEVELSIVPFEFHVEDAVVKNTQEFSNTNLLSVKEAYLELSLRKLFLENKMDVLSLEVIEPQLHFIAEGSKNNWQDIPLFSASGASEPSQAWFLESLVINNASILYEHRDHDFSVSLKKANLITYDVRPNQPFKIHSDFIYEHSQSPRVFDFEINGLLSIAQQSGHVTLNDWSGLFRLQLPKERNVPDIRMTTTGKSLSVDFTKQRVQVEQALLNGMSAEVQTSFKGGFGINPEFNGVFSAKKIEIKKWLELLGLPSPKMESETALESAGGQFDFDWNGEELKLDNVDVEIDGTKIQGRLHLPVIDLMTGLKSKQKAAFIEGKHDYDFSLKIDGFKPERYRLKESAVDAVLFSEFDWLLARRANGELELKNLELADQTIRKVSLELSLQDGQLDLAPLDIHFDQGALFSKLGLSSEGSQRHFYWKGLVEEVSAQDLLVGQSVLSGQLTSRFALLSTYGQTQSWKEQLRGHVQANLQRAQIKGFDLNKLLDVKKHSGPPFDHSANQLKLVGKIEKGVFTPKRFQLSGKQFNGAGSGSIDFVDQAFKGSLKLALTHPSLDFNSQNNRVLPFTFQGSFEESNWSIDPQNKVLDSKVS